MRLPRKPGSHARPGAVAGLVSRVLSGELNRLERLPVRWRLALTSAGLTFVILLLFAVVIGVFTARQVNASFDNDLRLSAADLQSTIHVEPSLGGLHLDLRGSAQMLSAAAAGDSVARIVDSSGADVTHLQTPNLGPPAPGLQDVHGYRVVSRQLRGPLAQPFPIYLQYGKPLRSVRHTIARVRVFLIFGVLAGAVLALLAGLGLARRAMGPIASLTRAAKEIARTRDPAVSLPKPAADDEVADLARTLEEMLAALGSARADTQAALDRQRQFVADASHELRTPLTSILANLELLEAELRGEEAEIAGSALRSSRRMRRLVGDLLLLARADAGRPTARERLDLGAIVREAAAEAAPMADGHVLSVDVDEAGGRPELDGSADELHRLVLNLVQNALVHTPVGTAIAVSVRREDDTCVLNVCDDGPGIPPELRERIFDRFVRGTGDRAGGGSGLGLAIVRAVTESHRGSVELSDRENGGARFVIRLPAAPRLAPTEATASPAGA